jgi:hypothetical protein
MFDQLADLYRALPSHVPAWAAIALGAGGLTVGYLYKRFADRDILKHAKRLVSLAIRYERDADDTYARTRALVEPTQSVPIVELLAAHSTPVDRLKQAISTAAERIRDGFTPVRNPADWAEGEMTAAFRAALEAESQQVADAVLTMPAQPSPWVHPLAVRHNPVPPPVILAPSTPQAAPRHQTLPAPVPSRDAVSRGRLRAAASLGPVQGPRLPGRFADWGPRLLGAPPVGELPPPITPFRMPVPQPRLPHDPRRLAMLAADDTRQWRTRRVAA